MSINKREITWEILLADDVPGPGVQVPRVDHISWARAMARRRACKRGRDAGSRSRMHERDAGTQRCCSDKSGNERVAVSGSSARDAP